uniref:Protein kinase domain-containing protein n=1 Tax=Ananas comosus var. bracteatus TaxID=296719 RepID=A0A6V7QA92_ANACO|nr:unnamed protein product [Ananas comosus var. bracteatus]
MLNSTLFLSFLLLLLLLLLLACSITALTPDGVSLLSFKYAVLDDPLAALADWDYADDTPCSWNGVVCAEFPAITNSSISISSSSSSRVIGLSLPNAQLRGAVPPELALIEHLRRLDLSGNALAGPVPAELALLPNLTTLSLANNYFYGELRAGVSDSLEVFDVSSNLINGSLPPGLGVGSLRYLNLSHNQISGTVPPELGSALPANATIDLSFNNLTGPIPQAGAFTAQNVVAFAGNPGLCGSPLIEKCAISSSLSDAPPNNVSAATATPPVSKAFAAIPESPNADSLAGNGGGGGSARPRGLRPTTIFAIAAGDFVGIGALFVVFLYIYQVKKRKHESEGIETKQVETAADHEENVRELGGGVFSCCFKKHDCGCGGSGDGDGTEESSETSAYAAAEAMKGDGEQKATLVTVDGETEIELEMLLKATAYVVGAAERGIVYKAVLVDGTVYAVRRIGEGRGDGSGSSSGMGKFREFEANVRAVAKLRHRNVLRLRGFYWGPQEKLLIHDFAPNGSLNNYSFTDKARSPSPFHLSFETRLRIARGVARGLAFLHDKKHVHGYIKPSNILLDADMEPLISDFSLDRLFSVSSSSSSSSKRSMSARIFGSKWSTADLPDLSSPCGGSSSSSTTPYHSPEMTQNLKLSAKSDVYSFGVVLLELIAGRVISEVEVCRWESGFAAPQAEKSRAMKMVNPAMRGAAEGREEALLSCFKLGFSCCAATPQKRPAMKDVLQVLERICI